MEWIAPFVISILVASTVFQLLMGLSISVIAKKNDQGSMMEVFAWIPILQLAPMLSAGGGSVGRFLLGIVALAVGNAAVFGAAAVLGEGLGTAVAGIAVAGIAIAFTVVICLGYYGLILWNTATNRGLSGWIGILMFIPLVNVLVYPFIAFHDGWARPHIAGMLLGTLITLGSMLPYLQVVQMLENDEEFHNNLARLAQGEDFAANDEMAVQLPDAADVQDVDPALSQTASELVQNQQRSIRALFDLKGRFETLDSLTSPENMRIQDHRLRALNQIRSIRADLEARRDDLDPEAYGELATHLVRLEARIQGPGTRSASSGLVMSRDTPEGSQASSSGGPASPADALDSNAAPIRPFPVQVADSCPYGTELRSRKSDEGDEEWCEQLGQAGGLRHGWYARYFQAGQPEQVGEYRDGLRVGVWTRFHRSGEVRAQAEFTRGLQHGWLLSFDESGARQKAVRFDRGVAVQ